MALKQFAAALLFVLLLVLLFVAWLAWAAQSIDDHSADWPASDEMKAALERQDQQAAFEAKVRDLCGQNAGHRPKPNGQIQCLNKFGRPTITVAIAS